MNNAVRSRTDGQLGFIVEHDGQKMVRLDRPKEELLVPYREDQWAPEPAYGKPTHGQIARIAYEADRSYRRTSGEMRVKEWESLLDRERIAWLEQGPPKGQLTRRSLYEAIFQALK